MAYSITPSADDCYPGTSVLVNKLNIRDQKQLNENEEWPRAAAVFSPIGTLDRLQLKFCSGGQRPHDDCNDSGIRRCDG